MIRYLAFCILLVGTVGSAQESRSSYGGETNQCILTNGYYDSVLAIALRPTGWQASLVTIAISAVGGEWKLLIRENEGKFEVIKATPKAPIYDSLRSKAKLCQLPSNPIEAAKLAQIQWSHFALSEDSFWATDESLIAAVREYVGNVQRDTKATLSTRRSFMHLHSVEYVLEYDNKSEHFVIKTNEDDDNAVTRWIRQILKQRSND
jgi:hypothetical protein